MQGPDGRISFGKGPREVAGRNNHVCAENPSPVYSMLNFYRHVADSALTEHIQDSRRPQLGTLLAEKHPFSERYTHQGYFT